MRYDVRVNGQQVGTLERGEIEERASGTEWANASVEVAETDSPIFLPLHEFLKGDGARAPAGAAGSTRSFEVRVNGHLAGHLQAGEIAQRRASWRNAAIEILDPTTRAAVSLDQVLKMGASTATLPQTAPSATSQGMTMQGSLAPATAFGPGPYFAYVNGELLGPMSGADIMQRLPSWWGSVVLVGESKAGPFMDVGVFLHPAAVPPPKPSPPQPPGPITTPLAPLPVQTAPVQPIQPAPVQTGGVQPAPLQVTAAVPASSPSAVGTVILTLITCNLFWLYWLWRSYKRVRSINPSVTTVTPGQAPGFLFIPLLGPFWFLYIAFDLPRAVLRLQPKPSGGMRFARVVASLMCVVGSLWVLGLGFPMGIGIPWVVGCEVLILGFIGYGQAALNRAASTDAGYSERRGAETTVAVACGVALVCAIIAIIFAAAPFGPAAPSGTPEDLILQAQKDMAAGNFSDAAQLLQQANTPEAQFELASLYMNGEGVPQDAIQAVSLMTAAAEAGHPLAQTTLGTWYANGKGVDANPETALEWYGKAAVQGDTTAQVLLGLAYAAGDGVDQDLPTAYMWFSVAAQRGSPYAASEKALLGESNLMDDSQKQTAEENASAELQREQGGQQ